MLFPPFPIPKTLHRYHRCLKPIGRISPLGAEHVSGVAQMSALIDTSWLVMPIASGATKG